MVPGGTSSRLFATDGDTIMRSTNLGCSWSTVFTLDPTNNPSAVGFPDALLRIWPGAVVTGIVAASPTVTYALVTGEGTGPGAVSGVAGEPLFWVASTNGGTSWQVSPVETPSAAGGEPLPVLAGATTPSLYVAPNDPRTVYVSLNNTSPDPTTAQYGVDLAIEETNGEAGTSLASPYRAPDIIGTTNGGSTWYALGRSLNTHSGGRLVIDPLNSRTLWTYGSQDWGSQDGVVSQSTDGGRTWYAAPRAPHTIGTRRSLEDGVQWLDVVHTRGSAARLLMNWPDANAGSGVTPPPTFYASSNGGRSWKVLSTPSSLDAWSYVTQVRPRWLCSGGQDALALAQLQSGTYYYGGSGSTPSMQPENAAEYRFLRLHRGAWTSVATPNLPLQANDAVSYSDFRSAGDDHQHLFLTAYVVNQTTTAAEQTTTTVTSYGLLYTGGC